MLLRLFLFVLEANENSCAITSSQPSVSSITKSNSKGVCSPEQGKLNNYLTKTNSTQKQLFDLQVAKYFYATNTPFLHAEHEEFKKLIAMLRPGYVPPTRFDIGGKLLDHVFKEEQNMCKADLENKTVCLSIDGWSNIRNDPIVCSCVTCDGKTVLVDTIDTTDHHHTGDYLETVASASIQKAELLFNCKVGSVVSDNAANMAKMRRQLQANTGDDEAKANIPIITYGCSAHILNLLAKDFEIPDATAHVLKVIKYFRNNHFAHAKYSLTKANNLVMPQEVRWNTMCDSLKSYVRNWPILMQIADENKEEISIDIRNLIQNVNIKRNAEDLVARLEPISKALDKIQSDKCGISESVLIWKELINNLEDHLNIAQMKIVMTRYQQAMTPAHFLAFMVNPKLPQEKLSSDEGEAALKFLQNIYGATGISLMGSIIRLNAKTEPFTGMFLEKTIIEQTEPIDWWVAMHNMKKCITEQELDIIKQLLGTAASSAGVERIFSAFNLVHSKIRNRLGTEKAAKLVFLLKNLNSKK